MTGTAAALGTLVLFATHNKSLPFVFAADDDRHGDELWRSDGTATGTMMVKDMCPGEKNSHPFGFTVLNGLVYFTADDCRHGRGLWKTDGTASGTVMVKDIDAGGLISFNGALFFTGNDGAHALEPWKTDGTARGTVMVKDLAPGIGDSSPCGYAPFGDAVYFWTQDTLLGNRPGATLWKTDGTEAGTVPLVELHPPVGVFRTNCDLIPFKGALYFTANIDPDRGYYYEIWKTDGTASGTVRAMSFEGTHMLRLTPFKDALFFRASTPVGNALFKTDGTPGGTMLVKYISRGRDTSCDSPLAVVGNNLYYTAMRPDNHLCNQLWKTDGTPGGTSLVKDVNPESKWASVRELMAFGDTLYFTLYSGTARELWKTNEKTVDPVMVKRFGAKKR